jgi:DNA polymerase-3 subunit delta'
LDDEEIANYLQEQKNIQRPRAEKIVQLADGNINLALKLTESEEDNNAQRFSEWMRACYKRNFQALVAMAEDYHGLDKLSQKNMIIYSINMMRETLLHSSGGSAMNRTRGEELKFVQDFSKVMSLDRIDQSFKLMNEATYFLERNGSAKMIFLDLSLKISKTLNP